VTPIHANQSTYPSGYNAAPIDRLDRAMLDFRDAWAFSSEHISRLRAANVAIRDMHAGDLFARRVSAALRQYCAL
jgi:hypothetical protein